MIQEDHIGVITLGRDLSHAVGVAYDPGGSHWDALFLGYWKALCRCEVDMACDVFTYNSTHCFMQLNAMHHSHHDLLYALLKCSFRVLKEHCRQSVGVE